MTRAELKGRIQTVLGPIAPEDLGPTLMHEHLLCDITPPRLAAMNTPWPEITLENYHEIIYGRVPHAGKYKLVVPELITDEVAKFRAAGGKSIVELTCEGLKPNPEGLAAIAAATDTHIVMGCGYYVEEYQAPATHAKTTDDFAREMIGQVLDGAWGTDIRSGIIGEVGCQAPWTDLEKKVMRAAIIAQQETGAAINVHPGRHPDQPQEAADFIRAEGGDLSRVVISHIDRTIFDEERLLRLADTGVVVEFDLFGIETTFYGNSNVDMPNDGMRLMWIRKLIEHGHLERIAISHDICYCTRLTKLGGHGYSHIFKNVFPLMRERGYTQAEIDQIILHTPARVLTFV
jgi:phosphotriesterase-related protein